VIDWLRFLDRNRIDYVIGPAQNVRHNHIGINCPRCGDDTKHHFSIDLESGKIKGCWRDSNHWMDPLELVAELTHTSQGEARRLLSEGGQIMVEDCSPKALMEELELLDDSKRGEPDQLPELEWPPEFYHFNAQRRALPYYEYLSARGFSNPEAVAECYGLRWCADGEWGPRIAFPLYEELRMVGWTARAITKRAKAKYKTHPIGKGVRRLLWDPAGRDDWLLVVCEGPFDALKIDWFAAERPVRAVAIMGLQVGAAKIGALVRAATGAREVVLLLDSDAEAQALELQGALGPLRARIVALPRGVKDPGDLSRVAVERLLDRLLGT